MATSTRWMVGPTTNRPRRFYLGRNATPSNVPEPPGSGVTRSVTVHDNLGMKQGTARGQLAGTLSIPSIQQNLSSMRVFLLAYSGTPLDSYMDSLLGGTPVSGYSKGPDMVEPTTTSVKNHIIGINPNIMCLQYANVTNIYGGSLALLEPMQDWLTYADAHSYGREDAFYHASAPYAFSGAPASARPVRWWWAIYRLNSSNALLNDYTQNGATPNAITFGASVGDYVSFGWLEKFRQITVTLSTVAVSPWAFALEYPTAVDGSGNPTTWATLSVLSDSTSSLTASGTIIFDPPSNWVPCTLNSCSKCFYFIRFRTTNAGGTRPVASSSYSYDYLSGADTYNGTVPAFDYAADLNSDGYLNASEYASRTAGKDAYFSYQGRIPYATGNGGSGYGPQRNATNPSSANFSSWAQDYFTRFLNVDTDYKSLFMDNSSLHVKNIGTATVVESTSNFVADYFSLFQNIWTAIYAGGTRFMLPNVAGHTGTEADSAIRGCRSAWYEFSIRPLQDDWTVMDDRITENNRVLALTPQPTMVVWDTATFPLYGAQDPTSTRFWLGATAAFYVFADPALNWITCDGGNQPNTTWQNHWRNVMAVNIGTPTGAYSLLANLVNDTTAPAANPSISQSATGGTIADGTYWWKTSYGTGNTTCESLTAAEQSIVVNGGTNANTLTIQPLPSSGLTPGMFVYFSTTSGGSFFRQGGAVAAGSPVTLTSLTFSGTAPPSVIPQYKVYARDYTLGYVVYKPISHKITGRQGTLIDLTSTTHSLPGTYTTVNVDGTLGAAVSTVSLRNGEGAVFLK